MSIGNVATIIGVRVMSMTTDEPNVMASAIKMGVPVMTTTLAER